MNTRSVAVRFLAFAACAVALGAGCSSSDAASKTQASTTTNAAEKPNQIPFEVGAPVGLPRGWLVQITKVERPYANAKLADAGDGRQHVAVDFSMDNRGTSTQTVNVAKLFTAYYTVHPDLAWTYHYPLPTVGQIAGLVAFYNEKLDLTVDGAALPRPQTQFS